jgi:N-acetylneuraminic acid mutarotase
MNFVLIFAIPSKEGYLIIRAVIDFGYLRTVEAFHLKPSLSFLTMFVFFLIQSSCGSPKNIVSPMPFATSTMTRLINTSIPTKTIQPSQTASPTPVIAGTWSEAPPMLVPRSAHAVVSSKSAIYALAGTDDKGRSVLDVEAFDGNHWNIVTTLPGRGLNAPTASIVGNRLYVVGGFTAVTNVPTDEVQVYDLQTQQWSIASPLPNPRGGHVAVVLDDKIHVLGGGNSASTIADHSQYDPKTDTWKELAPLPRAEGSPAAAMVDRKIYVIGGRSGSSDFGDVYIYDPSTDTWSTGPSIEPRGTAGAIAYCAGIYLFGGESQATRKNLDGVLRLDLERNIWETVTAMPTARKFARAVLFMDSVYIVGGSTVLASSHAPIGTASVERFTRYGCLQP